MPEKDSQNRLLPACCLALIVIGCVIIGVGIAWPSVVTPSMVWSNEQAEELQQAAAAFHSSRGEAAAIARSGGDGVKVRELTEQKYNRLKSELEAAQRVRSDWGTWVIAGGFGLTSLGGLGYLFMRGN